MNELKIRKIWELSYDSYCMSDHFQSDVQRKASLSILNCKSGRLGINLSKCTDCGHLEIHNNSCRNRSCPNCQAVLKEIWVDKRRAEVIDSPYFHVVFTLPHELNPLIYCYQKLLYELLHRCCAETLLELSADRKYLGRYTHKIAISNSRILSFTESEVTFSARGRKPSDPKRSITLKNEEFIRCYLMHVLPPGFQKIHYYGFLNNRMKTQNLKIIFKLQGKQQFKQRYTGITVDVVFLFKRCIHYFL